MESIGIDATAIKDINIKDNSIVYTCLLDNGIKSIVEISTEDNGDKVFNISENGKTDNIILSSNGKVYSDGLEVKLEPSVEYDNLGQRNIQTRSAISTRSVISNTMDCPKGRPSDYTDYDGSVDNSNVKLTRILSSYTATSLALLLSGLSGTPYMAGITYAIAYELINDFAGLAPNTSILSYKSKIYEHKDGPYMGIIYKKYVTTWYTEKNFGGDSTKVISYRITEYN